MSTETPYEGWAVVYPVRHRPVAGEVRQVAQFGVTQLRIDIPVYGDEGEALEDVVQFHAGPSIALLQPCSEDKARAFAKRYPLLPIGQPFLPARPPRWEPEQRYELDGEDPS